MTKATTMNIAPSALVLPDRGPRTIGRDGYVTQDQLIDDQLIAIRRRISAAIEQTQAFSQDPPAHVDWPHDVLDIEFRIAARVLAASTPLPLCDVGPRFALADSEMRILWLLISCELCPLVRAAMKTLSTEHVTDPTTDIVRRIVYGPGANTAIWRELGPEGRLRRSLLVERADDTRHAPDHRRTWKVSTRLLSLVHGDLALDPAIADIARIEDFRESMSGLELAGNAAPQIVTAFDCGDIVVVRGRPGSGRRSSLIATAHGRGLRVLTIDGRALSKDREIIERQLRAIARECTLLSLTPLVRDLDALSGTSDTQDRIELVERELPGLILATCSQPIARRWRRSPATVELQPITSAQRAKLWRRALPMAGSGDAEVLATTYPIAPALIEAAGRLAKQNCGHERMSPDHIEDALRSVLDDRLAGLAKRITITQSWNDLVLPDDQLIAVEELLARVRERDRVYEEWGFAEKVGRGLGVTALFSGPPGTGKTMAAGLIARQLRVELYQVDVSKIVSKWIGETEKNLAALFDAAESGHAILLFDEADALFGKRTDVKSSNDRHSNQETNYLLQRLESFTGICILTTNHDTAIDEAFRRRLSVHVRFPMPEREERARLWAALLPRSAPKSAHLDLDSLASKYVLSGGYIRNAVIRAAFLAADEGGVIDTARLSRAAQLEYEGLGKVVATKV